MTRSKIKSMLLFVWLLACAAFIVQAAPFAKEVQFKQPDGTLIELWGQGDEFYAVFETLDGYTVTFDPARKTYYYATVSADGMQLLATELEVGKGDPKAVGLRQHVRLSKTAVALQARTRHARWDEVMGVGEQWRTLKSTRQAMEAAALDGPILMSPPSFTTTGVKIGLCLLIDFEDDKATVPQEDIVDFCNADGFSGYGNNGSVKDYYLDNSNQLLTYTNIVTVYIRIPNSVHPKSYYNDTSKDCGTQANLLIHDAVAIMKALPNYASEIAPTFSGLTADGSGNITACNVFYAGGNGGSWTYGLWPHSSAIAPLDLSAGGKRISRYQITNIGSSLELGTFCHENGHMLCGYPDIYDYDYDSTGGAGNFCLMNSGGSGGNPVQICAYLKYASGWSTTIEVDYKTASNAQLTSAHGEDFNVFYRYAKPGTATEYFLFENRQKTGRDARIPASGIAIWHIDELGDRDNQSLEYNTSHQNYECTLVQADNLWHFEHDENNGDANDLYYLGNTAAAYANQFTDTSTPSARWWDGTASKLVAKGFSASATTMSFSFSPKPPVILTASVLPDGWVGSVYSCALTAVGGVAPYAWSVVSNTLPSGLSLSVDGVISGMPEEVTTAIFSLAVTGDNTVASTNQFSLTILPVHAIPFTETFENGGLFPESWSQEYVSGSLPWSFIQGSPQGFPSAAHGGSYNACLFSQSSDAPVTRLVSPQIDFGAGSHAGQLTFWHYMAPWFGDQDELRVYYRTSTNGTWTLIQTFATSVNAWTKRTVVLPEPNRSYYIAFEGTAKYGYGVCIDDVEITDPTLPLSITTDSPLPTATTEVFYSQPLAAVGGTPPYTYALDSGALPSGMSLSADGVISGTVYTASTASFVVRVSDSATATTNKSFTLTVDLPRADLFAENFEHGGQLPAGWVQEYVTNTVAWVVDSGGKFGHPSGAASGNFNMLLWSGAWENGNSYDQKTKLISPMIDLGQAPVNTRLTFWHCMEQWDGGQDELRVYYRTSATASWILLTNAVYTTSVLAWTQRSVVLPNPTSTYYIAFEGNARFGYGVCIDDIRISDSAEAPIITTGTPLANGLINTPYSNALAAVGGKTPYTWAVVSNALPSGLSLSSGGVISGTPDLGGTSYFLVRVMGLDGRASTNAFSLRILDALPIPYVETFENGGSIPTGWTQYAEGNSLAWLFNAGSPSGTPPSAHAGTHNACLYVEEQIAHKVMLVSPMLDLGTNTPNTKLTFWHYMKNWSGDQDELRIYYRTSKTNAWVLLTAFTSDVPGWTEQSVDLPNPSSTYYVAFEGTAKWGYGVCIDDVSVTGDVLETPYETWKKGRFTTSELADSLISGDSADPDNDGIINALEYAYGLDPKVGDTVGLPFGGITDNHLFINYRENKEAADVVFLVEACTSLVDHAWTTVDVSELAREDSNTWEQVTAIHNVPVTNAPRRFLRLKVNVP